MIAEPEGKKQSSGIPPASPGKGPPGREDRHLRRYDAPRGASREGKDRD